MKNKLVILLAVAIAISLIPTTINAGKVNTSNDLVYPMFEQINNSNIYINFLENILYIDYSLFSKNLNSQISGSIHLERFVDGQWVNIKTWFFISTGSVIFSKNYKTEKGYAYRIKVSATVDDEKITGTSNIVQL